MWGSIGRDQSRDRTADLHHTGKVWYGISPQLLSFTKLFTFNGGGRARFGAIFALESPLQAAFLPSQLHKLSGKTASGIQPTRIHTNQHINNRWVHQNPRYKYVTRSYTVNQGCISGGSSMDCIIKTLSPNCCWFAKAATKACCRSVTYIIIIGGCCCCCRSTTIRTDQLPTYCFHEQ